MVIRVSSRQGGRRHRHVRADGVAEGSCGNRPLPERFRRRFVCLLRGVLCSMDMVLSAEVIVGVVGEEFQFGEVVRLNGVRCGLYEVDEPLGVGG
jgi:hypothetical protein